jgi:hypothetical protein
LFDCLLFVFVFILFLKIGWLQVNLLQEVGYLLVGEQKMFISIQLRILACNEA